MQKFRKYAVYTAIQREVYSVGHQVHMFKLLTAQGSLQ